MGGLERSTECRFESYSDSKRQVAKVVKRLWQGEIRFESGRWEASRKYGTIAGSIPALSTNINFLHMSKFFIICIASCLSLLLIDLCLCIVGIGSPSVGSDPIFAATVGGVFMLAMLFMVAAIIGAAVKMIKNENDY